MGEKGLVEGAGDLEGMKEPMHGGAEVSEEAGMIHVLEGLMAAEDIVEIGIAEGKVQIVDMEGVDEVVPLDMESPI